MEGSKMISEESSVDWRGRPSNPLKHGGMRAAAFVLGVQGFEIMAIAAVGNNLITYVINEMHFSLSKSANTVTNFIGTVFILALLGGYLSDSYLGCFWTMLIFAFVELSGFILLSVQAHLPQLKPPPCNMLTDHCEEAKGFKALIFFVALYLVALGSGCVKPNMIAHGADQFNQDDPKQSKKLSRYFNAAYFAFSMGELIALTVLVYVQTHSGMDVGFGVSAAAMAMGLISLIGGTFLYRNKPPQGSILTPIVQRKQICPSDPRMLNGYHSNTDNSISDTSANLQLTHRFRFLNKACIKTPPQNGNTKTESPWKLCSIHQVEQVKILISIVPIFACTIIFNTILAQLQTFSVQQGSSMNTHLTNSFQIPPASLQAIPYIMLALIVPLIRHVFRPVRAADHGPRLSSPSAPHRGGPVSRDFLHGCAAHGEKATDSRRRIGRDALDFLDRAAVFDFRVSEMFTAVGLIEFFYKQSLKGMQSFLTSVTYCSYSFGFFLSSVLVTVVNKVTSNGNSSSGWLSDNDLNKDRLDLFYWVLAVLSFLNFINYVFWARWYTRVRSDSSALARHESNTMKVGGDDHNVYPLNDNV
ncbi:hypothetical protein DH2020_003101 [Rehmannia glutinosa]|uniref:Uncharacterized protein n=1 Tax=Rehmannia glutinosa TaxID=99300 RepID=A0ABR0XKL6_REHGL